VSSSFNLDEAMIIGQERV